MKNKTRIQGMPARSAALGLAATLAASGCGNGSKTANPGPVNSIDYNSYLGTQTATQQNPFAFSPVYGGVWNFTRDDSSSYFTYDNIGVANALGAEEELFNSQLIGSAAASGGFAKLTLNTPNSDLTRFNAGGYAVEIPGSGALLRPGDATYPPVVAAQANSCLALKTPVTYQFVALGTPFVNDNNVHVAYGSIDLSSGPLDNIGSNRWTPANLKMFALDGTDLQPAQLAANTCAVTQAGYAVNILPANSTGGLAWTLAVGATGLMVLDQDQGDQNLYGYQGSQAQKLPGATGPLGIVGVQKPTAALDTGALSAAKYLGFESSAIAISSGAPGDFLVSFGASSGNAPTGGETLTGGRFPNDDPTQTPQSTITLDLGPQDANAGLFKSVVATVPDSANACIGQPYGGTDPAGNPTCAFKGVAVAGQADGKYILFVTVNDLSQQTRGATARATLQFFLYQQ